MYAVRTEKKRVDRHTDQRMERNNHNSKNDLKRARKKRRKSVFCKNHFSALALARREKKKVLWLLVGVHGLTLYVPLMTR